jgi:hypothetical protein
MLTLGRGRAISARVALCSCFAVALVAFGPAIAPASALQFGSEGTGAGEFIEAHGDAVEQESGDLYLVDRNNSRVEKFTGTGQFLFAWGWGVADGSTEALQTCTATCLPALEGGGAGEFELPTGVAVDNDALSASHEDVYVGDPRNHRVQKFGPNGEFLLMFGREVNATADEEGGATEAQKNVCTAGSGDTCKAGVEGEGEGELLSGGAAIAVDAEGTVYVGDTNRVEKFSGDGAFLEQIAISEAGEISALAVNSSNDIYIKGSGLSGVREFDSGGTEVGGPLDETGEPSTIAIGGGDNVFIDDGSDESGHHLLEYDALGNQLASFDAGTPGGSRGIAFGQAAEGIYVLNTAAVRLAEIPPPGPLVVAGSQSATEIGPTGATLNATVNPEGDATEYHFEYGTSASYGSSTTVTPLTGGTFEDQAATAAISGLSPRTTYHFRVVATNGASETTLGPDQTFETLPPAVIVGESVSQITAKTARLEAEINPLGTATSYRFEYGTTTAYGTTLPEPDGSVGEGTSPVALSVPLTELTPGTVYHFRVVATNGLGETDGTDRSFTTQSDEAVALLDGRAWELVSPPNKHGVSLEAITEEGGVIEAAEDGSAFTYIAKAPIDTEPSGTRSIANTQLLANRTGSGWGSRDITTPHESVVGLQFGEPSEYDLFSGDLSQSLVEAAGATPLAPTAEEPNPERTPYRREADGTFTPLVTAKNVVPGTHFGGSQSDEFLRGARFVGATPDLTHIIVKSPEALTPGFESNEFNSLFEWEGGALSLVSILPDGTPVAEDEREASLGFGNLLVRNAVSNDGSRVVFEAATLNNDRHLYLRDTTLKQTVQLDVPFSGQPKGASHPHYQLASSDGSRIFFTDEARLTPNSRAKEGQADLYLCEVKVEAGQLKCTLRDVTVPLGAGEAADVRGVAIGAGDDASRVYFVANGVLSGGATRGNCIVNGSAELPPAENSCTLYMYDVNNGETVHIAQLANRDRPDWEAPAGADLGGVTARVSPNGRYLAFMSQRPITGYDNRDVQSGERDEEVFLFDADANVLRCVSCLPSKARPSGIFDSGAFPGLLVDRPNLWGQQSIAGSIPGWTRVTVKQAFYQSRYLSDEGRLFFNSADGLVPQDSNKKEDVYEYEPNGLGGCDEATGCIGLLSGGKSSEESAFLDASVSGDNSFFLTATKLVPEDVDSAFDVYDARVCSSGSPCLTPSPLPAPPCSSADSCRAAPTGQAGLPSAPASLSAGASGNLAPIPVVKPKPPTRAQLLQKALAACKKKKVAKKRAACRAQAKKRYGPKQKAKAKARKGKSKSSTKRRSK